MVAPEDYLQKTSLRPMLASLLEKTCKDKPDNLVPFMLEYLQTTYPDAAKAAQPANPPGSLGSWSKRPDVQPTQEGLQAYLAEIKARSTLETVLEQALRQQPANVVAFVIESLCSSGDGMAAPTGSAAGVAAATEVYADVATRQDAHPDAPALQLAERAACPVRGQRPISPPGGPQGCGRSHWPRSAARAAWALAAASVARVRPPRG